MSASTRPATLAEMVRLQGRNRGDATAFEFEGRITGFAEFDRNTNRVANALRALGVRPGERIAYLGKNSDNYFELLLGAMKANVVMAPVNWRLSRSTSSRRCRAIRPGRFYGGSCVIRTGRGENGR